MLGLAPAKSALFDNVTSDPQADNSGHGGSIKLQPQASQSNMSGRTKTNEVIGRIVSEIV
jgi:hypothetical protein